MDLIHASVLSPQPLDTTREGFLAFHWYQGTVLLRQMLLKDPSTCTGSDCDALWSAAALLGTASFAYVEGKDPTEVWPLKRSDASDLNWLRMGDGKMAVSAAFDSLEIDSLFAEVKKEARTSPLFNTPTGITPGVFPPSFYTVFGLESFSRQESNAYYRVAALLNQSCQLEHDASKMNILFVITHQMDERFKRLLHVKDHRAMLLLAWCYVRSASSSQWWMRKRSFLEGLAICQYLERECHANPMILELLEIPRATFERSMREDKAQCHGAV
jgi:hypothetical protein